MKKLINSAMTVAAVALFAACNQVPSTADLLITGGTVYDGINDEPKVADIAIKGDKIVYFADAKSGIAAKCNAAKVIDATGYVVSPGFIDPHNHLEPTLLNSKACESYLRMGVTTVIPGQCGGSPYPIADFFATLEQQGIGPNTACFTGHNTIRKEVMGDENRFATDEEIEKMQNIFRKEMENGSLGLSSGLYYVPGCFSENKEVLALCKTAAENGGIYTTHVRHENKDGIGLYNSIVEALDLGKNSGVQVNISHIKCLGKSSWYKADSVIAIIEQYQKEGVKVTADQYPYLASGLRMSSALTPAWSRDGGVAGLRERLKDPKLRAQIKSEIPDMIYERGGAETIYISKDAGEYNNMTLAEAAAKMKCDPAEAVVRMMENTEIKPYLNTFVSNDQDVEKYMVKDWVLSCTDGSYGSHPRAAGTYAELIQKYVVEKQVLSLARFIRRSTSQVAETYGFEGRGAIKKGAFADIAIFAPQEVRANASYADPIALATGFKSVIVNGVAVVENDEYTGALPGKILRKSTK